MIGAAALIASLVACLVIRNPNDAISLFAAASVWFAAGVSIYYWSKPAASVTSVTTRGSRILVATAAILLLSMVAATVHTQSRYYSYAELGLAGLAPLLSIALALYMPRLSAPDRARGTLVLGLSVGVVACAGIAETAIHHLRPLGPFQDFNVPGALANAGMLPLVATLAARQGRTWHWVVLGVLALGQAVTVSRGADIALAVCLALLGFSTRFLEGSLRAYFAAVLLVIAGHLAVQLLPFQLRESGTLDLLRNPERTASQEPSAVGRIAVWRSTLRAYEYEAPLLGTGLGTFVLVYPRYRDVHELQTAGGRAHSDYLERLLEGGPILFVAMVLFGLWMPLMAFFGGLRRNTETATVGADRIVVAGSALACVALGLHACINFIFVVPVLSFLFAWHLNRAVGAEAQIDESPRYRSLLRGLGAIAALLMPPILILVASGQWLMSPPGLAYRERNPQAWLRIATIGEALQPSNRRFREATVGTYLGVLREANLATVQRASLIAATKRDLDAWLSLSRCDTHAWESMARFADEAPESAGTTALDAYAAAFTCQPQSLALRIDIAELLERRGDTMGAYSMLRGGLAWFEIAEPSTAIDRWAAAGLRLASQYGTPEEAALWHEIMERISNFRGKHEVQK